MACTEVGEDKGYRDIFGRRVLGTLSQHSLLLSEIIVGRIL
jgi:hypothetical protein